MKKNSFSAWVCFVVMACSVMFGMASCSSEDDDFRVWDMDLEEEALKQGVTVSGNVAGYTYVDLGLSVKWATYNVGATLPETYGSYFAWGETEPKTNFTWDNYKFADGWYSVNKYTASDTLSVLESEDDAATANWGAAWRMPTLDEWRELVRGCEWHLDGDFYGSGVAGIVGTSSKNDATIFIPCAGYYDGSSNTRQDEDLHYWSSVLYSSYYEESATSFYLTYSNSLDPNGKSNRYMGFTVRPVLNKK